MKRPKRPLTPYIVSVEIGDFIKALEKYATQTESKLKIAENLLLRSNEIIINLQEEIDEYFRVEKK